MCGICGKLNFKTQAVESKIISSMIQSMLHRGPDSQGTFFNSNIGLGHCRLSIIDLSNTANQPMIDFTQRYSIVYNGEVYNFLQLKKELQDIGIHFRTSSDTEVILEAYKKWGEEFLHKLHGMFAFAIWDKQQNELFLARDRFGVKPLYYRLDSKSFSFASEIQALLIDKDCSREIDLEGLHDYLSLNYIPGATTIYQSIKKLEPGRWLKVRNGHLKIEQWYHLPSILNSQNQSSLNFDLACEKLRYLLRQAVKKRLIADVPLGAFLSGGLDSSLIVALMAEQTSQKIKTFTIGYKNQKTYDETPYAKVVAQKFSTDHQVCLLSHEDILNSIPTLLNRLGEPFGDPSLLPSYVLCQQTRQYVTVALSGDAGDEVFGGYEKYSGEILSKYYLRIPQPIRSKLIPNILNFFPASRTSKLGNTIRKAKKFITGISDKQHERHYAWMEIFNKTARQEILTKYSCIENNPSNFIQNLQAQWLTLDSTNRMLYTDLNCCLPYNMFYKVDIASMLNSLEVRSPFIDHNLVEFAFSLPGNFKLNHTNRKHILVESFSKLLPTQILQRPKHGFDVPIGEWFRNELKALFHETIFSKKNAYLDTRYISTLYNNHLQRKQDYTFALWNIFVLQWWLNKPFI